MGVWAASFRKGFTIVDCVLALPFFKMEEAIKGEFVIAFVNFWKLNTTSRVLLMQHVEALGLSIDMQWGIYALYESVLVKACTLLGCWIDASLGVKQGFPSSPTLFGLYIDEGPIKYRGCVVQEHA